MTRTQGLLLDTLTPVRDISMSYLLEEMGRALDRNFEVITDPMRRDENGNLEKWSVLGLPVRSDLETRVNGSQAYFDISEDLFIEFDPLMLRLQNDAPVSISPFKWSDMQVALTTQSAPKNWKPLRQWYLEAFQERFDRDSPDIHGVVHSLNGPYGGPENWQFSVDLGTANVDVISDLLTALNALNATRVEIFGVETSMENMPAS